MPKVEIHETAIVVARPGVHVTYSPGKHLAPDAHIVDVERQGRGLRLTMRGEGRAKARDTKAPGGAAPAARTGETR
jgi:hypothetical protein